MPTLFERIAARFAYWHADRVYARFLDSLRNCDAVQANVLQDVLARLAGSDYARKYRLDAVRAPGDLKLAAPLVTYEDLRPYVERLCDGQTSALLAPGQHLHMFATSSGTTARQKLIPVTAEFVRQYRRGWNTFGLKLLRDHPRAVLRAILQASGRVDESYTPSGIPCGAITGLLARTQKGIVRRFYVDKPEFARIVDPSARYYTLMRFAIVRDVAFAVTANPATFIRLAQTANEQSEHLLRDVRDGTLSGQLVPDPILRRRLQTHLTPAPDRARELEKLRSLNGALRPRDYWQLEFLACWIAGSMGQYLRRLTEWWGPLPLRDIGLLASEGRVTIPLEDGTPTGVLDVQGAFFEFIPSEHWNHPNAQTLTASELETERDYTVVLTNSAGLVRYRLDDVVRVRGWLERTPLIEFLYRAGRVASVAGEKLTENQVVEAVRMATERLRLPDFDFLLSPRWDDPPFYQLNCTRPAEEQLALAVDQALAEQNDEYRSRRNSLRLGKLQIKSLRPEALARIDRRLAQARGSSPEQYKRPCLLTRLGEDEEMLGSGD